MSHTSEDGSRPGQGTSGGQEITDGHCVSPLGNPTKRKHPVEGRRDGRDELDDYWKGTTWQRIAQDRQMWKQHAEAFAQPKDISIVNVH